jgi:hypothetical protein
VAWGHEVDFIHMTSSMTQVTSSRLKCSKQEDKFGCSPHNETLIKYSFYQKVEAQVDEIVFILGLEYRYAVVDAKNWHSASCVTPHKDSEDLLSSSTDSN